MRFILFLMVFSFLFLNVTLYPIDDLDTSAEISESNSNTTSGFVFLTSNDEDQDSIAEQSFHGQDVENNVQETVECVMGVTLNSTSCRSRSELQKGEIDQCKEEALQKCRCPEHTVCRQATNEDDDNTKNDDVTSMTCTFMCVPNGKNRKMFNFQMLRHV